MKPWFILFTSLILTGCISVRSHSGGQSGAQAQQALPGQSLVGRAAPAFTAPAVSAEDTFVNVTLPSLYGDHQYLLLVFYPGDFTFVCPTELTELNDQRQAFIERDCAIAAASVDSLNVHLAWRLTPVDEGGVGRLQFPLIADREAALARAYGVAAEDGSALRAWFIIDRKSGRVRHQLVNEAAHGRSVAEALRVLDAIRFTDSHSGVCPEGWKSGDKIMQPNREGLLQFLMPGS